jgi:hypothetical protein
MIKIIMNKYIVNCCISVIIFFLFNSCGDHNPKGNWKELINGENLEGWVQKGGKAIYTAEDGMIIGTTVPNTENSFLCTEKIFSDFILELEVMDDTALNSGIQFRSNAYQNGRVYGYQVEIDPTSGGYSGGIYDEARRGWLQYPDENDPGRKAFQVGKWNQYRIEAIGNSLKTWINGIMCVNVIDEANDSGFISLQVHSVDVTNKPWTEGIHVKWRNIRIMTENLNEFRTISDKEVPVDVTLVTNELTPAEKEEGWKLLFDGKTTTGWRGAQKDKFPESGWLVEKDSSLTVQSSAGEESKAGGDIVTLNEYSDFELMVDVRLTPGANSGIKYYVTENEKTAGSAIGLEYQILDDNLHPDAGQGRNGNRTMASLYDLIPASQDKYVCQVGQWNMARIISKDNNVEHWLNGSKVLEYERGSEDFKKLVAISKYKIWKNFGEAEKGHILLQEHGNQVSFRNIKIREL